MNRRRMLAGTASLAALGAGGILVSGRLEEPSRAQLDAIEIDPLDVPSSPEQPFRVPFEGTITVIDLFATWCDPCIEHMETLRAVHDDIQVDARFVSVTNEAIGGELTRADIRAWWAEHGGNWPSGFDNDGKLTRETDSRGLPHTAVVDERGEMVWSKSGTVGMETLQSKIQDAVD